MITMENVCKSYKVAKRNAGFGEAWKALFRREYETIHALRNVSFTIEDGEMVGYIGPNGAGKSSTIKILSGILTPDSGTVLVDGRVPYKDRIRHVAQIGVLVKGPSYGGTSQSLILLNFSKTFIQFPKSNMITISKS